MKWFAVATMVTDTAAAAIYPLPLATGLCNPNNTYPDQEPPAHV